VASCFSIEVSNLGSNPVIRVFARVEGGSAGDDECLVQVTRRLL
jgi:hypothetical protein